jgi:hypothetical protein
MAKIKVSQCRMVFRGAIANLHDSVPLGFFIPLLRNLHELQRKRFSPDYLVHLPQRLS